MRNDARQPALRRDHLGLSPAPIMIAVGVVLGQAFLMWARRRQQQGKTPLLALDVIESVHGRAAVYAMFSVVALEAALNFSVPLYVQIVQGRSPMATAIAMMPFNLSVFAAQAYRRRRNSERSLHNSVGILLVFIQHGPLVWRI